MASNSFTETPDDIGGNRESSAPLPAGFDWQNQSSSYLKREQSAWPSHRTAYDNAISRPRLAAWDHMVGMLKASGLDDKSKMQVVNAWVNEAIRYDQDKYSKSKNVGNDPNWYQTSFHTLDSGKGVCGDIGRLKYQTLKAVGIDDKNMRLVGGDVHDLVDTSKTEAHELLMVNTGGRSYLLNNNMAADGNKLDQGGVELASSYFQGKPAETRYGKFGINGHDAVFVPTVSENGQGLRAYNIPWDPKKGAAQYPSFADAPADTQNATQVREASSSVNINNPADSEQIKGLIKEARDLRISGLSPKPAVGTDKAFKDIKDWLDIPSDKQASLRDSLEKMPPDKRDDYYEELKKHLDPETHKIPVDADKRKAALDSAADAASRNGGVLRNPQIDDHTRAIADASAPPAPQPPEAKKPDDAKPPETAKPPESTKTPERTSRHDQDTDDTKPATAQAPSPTGTAKPKEPLPKKSAKNNHADLRRHPHHHKTGKHPAHSKSKSVSNPQSPHADTTGLHVTLAQDSHGTNTYSLMDGQNRPIRNVEVHGEIYGPTPIHGATVQDPTINKLLQGTYTGHRNPNPPAPAVTEPATGTSNKGNNARAVIVSPGAKLAPHQ